MEESRLNFNVPEVSEEDIDTLLSDDINDLPADTDEKTTVIGAADDEIITDDDPLDELLKDISDDGKEPKDATEEDEDETTPDDKGGEYKPGQYLTELNEKFELNLNMEQLPEGITASEEMDAVKQILDNRQEAFRERVEQLENFDKLMTSDEETKLFLQARAEGKTLKDLFAELGSSVDYSNEDQLVAKYIKDMYDFDDTTTSEEIQKLKDSDKYEGFKEKVAAAYKKQEEEAALAASKKAEQEIEQGRADYLKSVQDYKDFVDSKNSFGEFQLDDKIKKDLVIYATKLDQEGYTSLEQDLQSKENALKASLAIKYWSEIEKVLSTAAKESSKKDLLTRLTVGDSTRLQSSTSSTRKDSDFSDEIANQF